MRTYTRIGFSASCGGEAAEEEDEDEDEDDGDEASLLRCRLRSADMSSQ